MADVTRVALAKAVIVTAEVMGHELSVNAAEAMARELAAYPSAAALGALRRCQRELSGRLTLAAVLQRIDDGHPPPDEAWAMCPRDENVTVVWTEEMQRAFFTARPLLQEGDQVAARMAFRECYTRLLQEARNERRSAVWTVSPGHDKAGLCEPVVAAVERGRLKPDYARVLVHAGLPDFDRYEKRLNAAENVTALPPGDADVSVQVSALTANIGRRIGA
jgi:hypothetical protein